jgi:MraZ protein
VKYLFGRFDHTIDPKGRLAIPQRIRERLLEVDSRVRVFVGFEGCLFCYPSSEVDRILEQLDGQDFDQSSIREVLRWLSEYGSDVEIDAQGRIPLTEDQRREAGLGREVVLIGAGRRLEFWSPERFSKRPNKADGATFAEGILSGIKPAARASAIDGRDPRPMEPPH